MKLRVSTGPWALLLLGITLAGCGKSKSDRVQGYVEGEYVYVASPLAGELQTLAVSRGDQVKANDPLFALESVSETAARDQAERKLAEGRATLADMKKGKRPQEIDALQAQLKQARAALVLSEREYSRQESLFKTGASAASDHDKARSARDQDAQRVSQLEADLETAQLGSRTDQISASDASTRALESALAKAQWDLDQKRQAAPQGALVFDTLYRQGEWVPAGRPVVTLLPPPNIKVRAFVPQARLGSLQPGAPVRVFVDGVAAPFSGKVSYISPHAEFTPPVIYSQESRGKLVFMIESVFAPEDAAKLHPGQPVDVEFP